MPKDLVSLKEDLEKKDKTIDALSKYVEQLSGQKSGVTSEIQTSILLEKKLKEQQLALKLAKKQVALNAHELSNERDFMRATMNSLSEGVIVTDLQGVIFYTNPAIHRLVKSEAGSNSNKFVGDILSLQTDESLPIELVKNNGLTTEVDHNVAFIEHNDGSKVTIEWCCKFISNIQNERIGLVFTTNDITASYNLTNKLKHQASHDTLTGLLNRQAFDNRLSNCLSDSHKLNVRHSLIYIDLDQFKIVNDSCGHQAGDQLLRQLSSIISPLVRGRDTLARLGGDEFVILLETCPKDAALKVANDILECIQKFRFSWENKSFNVGASMGIAHFSSGSQRGNDPLSAADKACYKAKEDGRDRINEVDISNIQPQADVTQQQTQWVNKLNAALDNDQFVLFQQKISPTNPDTNEFLHYEVLLRLKDDDGSLINPGAFLPPAERYGLIHQIDHWVIKNTLAWLAQHPDVLVQTKLCSINLSGVSLSEENLSSYVKKYIKEYNIDCNKICFEITESSAIQNFELAIGFMEEMHELGCSFSLDDFGTGMSSFSYLKLLPVNHLKIDGSFIRHIDNDPIDLAMTRSINEIGRVMGMSTIGEFVENKEILQRLKQLGVDYAQGYYIAKPAPLDELLKQIT